MRSKNENTGNYVEHVYRRDDEKFNSFFEAVKKERNGCRTIFD